MKKIICLLLCAFPLVGVSATSSHKIKQESNAQLKLLEKLVNINSGSTNIAGVNRVGKIVAKELQQLGFKINFVAEPKNLHRAATLIATHPGREPNNKILLIAHLDTVFPPQSKFQRYELHQQQAKGPGVTDDKGGIVVLLFALKTLQQKHLLHDANLTVVLTGDEEDSGKPVSISRKALRDAAKGAVVALDFEPSITLNTATVSRRGIVEWKIETSGNESHSATIFQKGVGAGAIFSAGHILSSIYTAFKDSTTITINPGIIAGGAIIEEQSSMLKVFGKENIVAKKALIDGDFRFMDEVQKQQIKSELQKILQTPLPSTHATIQFTDSMPAMPATTNNHQLLARYSEVSERIGHGPVHALPANMRGAGDISYVADIVPANLSGLGPTGFGTHTVIETVDLASFPIQTARAAALLADLIQTPLA